MEFWDVVEGRRSVRDFTGEPVAPALIERLLAAATRAPSSQNSQPWRFHIMTGAARAAVGQVVSQTTIHLTEYMDTLGPEMYEYALKWYSSLGDAPVVIGVSLPRPQNDFDAINKLLSAGAAIENLLLAVTDLGLGACNVTFSWWVRDELNAVMELEDDRNVIAIIALGHPAQVPPFAPPRRDDVAEWLE